ncbi:MAG: IS66 family insertion sequence element accessory protein TnpB [Actinobacteria bacterium]|nr:IS66 family insertion sequence element accessory protein TnpB [Actinomycetota bacterium]
MKILVAVEPADFRRGIDGLARLCQEAVRNDPFAGAVFVFRDRKATALKVLMYDSQGFWLCHERLSQGRFPWWPSAAEGSEGARRLAAQQLSVLLAVGDPMRTGAAADWRPVGPLN